MAVQRPQRLHVGQLTTGFGVALALATLVSGILVFAVARYEMNAEVDEWLAGDVGLLLPAGSDRTLAWVMSANARWEQGHSFSEKGHVLFDRDGRIVSPGRIAMRLPPPGYSEVAFRDGNRNRSGRALTVPLAQGGALVVIAHSEIGEAAREMLLPAIVAGVLAAGLAGLAGSWYLGRMVASRSAGIQAAADTIAYGDLSHRISLESLDGIFADQALSLNRMLDRMEAMVRSQRQFASHVAHDLRTPLTRLRALLGRQLDAGREERARLIERAEHECSAIIATFDALLRLSEVEAGRAATGLIPLNLRAVVDDVVETMEPVVADAGSSLVLVDPADACVRADVALLQQLLVNLIENVVIHTPSGTQARMSLTRDDKAGRAVITLVDDGPGIAADAIDKVTQPFERGTTATQAMGHGLGLAIAEAIMRFHGGELRLADAAPGLRVELRLPLVSEVAPAAA